jgi:BMFP domain-containing protein YqiC
MSEDRGISMSEFKMVVESFHSDLKKISEVVQHIHSQVQNGFQGVNEQLASVKEQIAVLHVGQTEIKHALKRKVDQDDFDKLETRVTTLENKVA